MYLPFSRLLLTKSWRQWLCTVAAISVGGVIANHSERGASLSACMLIMVILSLFSALALPEPQQQRVSGFPNYMFLLPLTNFELVAVPMLIAGLLLGVTGGLIAIVILGTIAPIQSTWWISAYLAGNCCLVQAVSWVPLKRPEIRVTFMFVTVAAIVAGPAAFGLGWIGAPLLAMAYLGVMAASIAAAVSGVGSARHGLTALQSSNDSSSLLSDLPPFRSKVCTQQWLEEKRNGLIMRVLTGMFLVIFAVIAVAAVPFDSMFLELRGVRISGTALGLVALTLGLPPYIGYGGCCGSEQDNITKDRSIVPFLALRPLTTLQIIESKFRATIRQALILTIPSLALALIILLLPTTRDGHYQPTIVALGQILTVPQGLGLVLAYALVVLGGIKTSVSGIWCALGRFPIWATVVVSFMPLVIVFGVLSRLVMHPEFIPDFLVFLPKVVWIFAGVKLLALGIALAKLRELRLVPDAVIIKWLSGCAAFGLVIYGISSSAIPSDAYSRWAIAAQVFCILPLVRVALAPVFVYRGRHG